MVMSDLRDGPSRSVLTTFGKPVAIDGVFLPTESAIQTYTDGKPSHFLIFKDIKYEPVTEEEAAALIRLGE